MVNSSWDEAAQEIVVHGQVNLGIAAATPRGLVVPNIRDAGRLSLAELAGALAELTATARAGRTAPADMTGGTFTITNVGVFGVDSGTPILNPGEAAILAFGAVHERPWVHKGKVRSGRSPSWRSPSTTGSSTANSARGSWPTSGRCWRTRARRWPSDRLSRRELPSSGRAAPGPVSAALTCGIRRVTPVPPGVGRTRPITRHEELRTVASVQESVDVDVPIRVAYDQWTQFESFPQFMGGVEKITQIDDTHTHWVTNIDGVKREFDAEITEQHPEERVAWTSTRGEAKHAGVVTFHRLDDAKTRVMIQIDWEPEGLVEKAGAALGRRRPPGEGDAKRFKEFIESRGSETGAWRGDVPRPN